jgi:lipoyl(octanoyl) transferase
VEELICRLLPFDSADGPTNMATDEVLLQAAVAGTATLRFYGWPVPTVSLGYFQSEKLRRGDPLLEPLPFVRRPSGGEMLVHHHEVTYALALPPGTWQRHTSEAASMHQLILTVLARLGMQGQLSDAEGARPMDGPLCFQHVTRGDVLLAGAKVAGSARRKRRGAVLQHGGILLARSPHAPALPGIRDLTGRDLRAASVVEMLRGAFAAATDARLQEAVLSNKETEQLNELKDKKYGTTAWNCKR